MSSLGKSQDTYGDLLIPIILEKLPTEIGTNLAREHGHLEWNIDELREAIKEIHILEQGLFMSASSFPHTSSPPPITAASFLTSTQEGNSKGGRQRGG